MSYVLGILTAVLAWAFLQFGRRVDPGDHSRIRSEKPPEPGKPWKYERDYYTQDKQRARGPKRGGF
jgi:hypothetical protein